VVAAEVVSLIESEASSNSKICEAGELVALWLPHNDPLGLAPEVWLDKLSNSTINSEVARLMQVE
jgi:hypothetical protein